MFRPVWWVVMMNKVLVLLSVLVVSADADADGFVGDGVAERVGVDNFDTMGDLEVTVWASTPMLFNPTNMDIDHKGRVWVAEGVNYRKHAGRRAGGDRIVVLEDTDGDGAADSSHTFVQEVGLVAPLGVAVFDNRVYVSQPPDIICYTDVDRDLKFDPEKDKREVILSGFNAVNHDHSLHSVTAGPDGKMYFNNGNCGAVFTDNSGKKFIMGNPYRGGGGKFTVDHHSVAGESSDDGYVWSSGFTARMNADGTDVEIVGHGYRNSYEQSLSSYGDAFQSDNDDPPACRVSYILEYGSAGYFTRDAKRFYKSVKRRGQEHGRAHWRQDDPGTMDAGDVYGGGSPTGVTMYENGALGDGFVGSLLACEPGRNQVFHYKPVPEGASFKLERGIFTSTNVGEDFQGSDFVGGGVADEGAFEFRPSDITVGPDGAVYVCDWYDKRVGGHADLDDTCSGTIYRIAPRGFKPSIPEFDLATVEGAVEALRSPGVNTRFLGFEGLVELGESALPSVLKVLEDENRFVAARGIWILPYLGEGGRAKVVSLLDDEDASVRLTAFRALRRAGEDMLGFAEKMAEDSDAGVRRDVALSLRGLPAEKTKGIFTVLARQVDVSDKNALEAIGLGAAKQESEVWEAVRSGLGEGDAVEWSDLMVRLTWRLWPVAAVPDLMARARCEELSEEERFFAVESLAFIDDEAAAEALFELVDDVFLKEEVTGWLLRNGLGEWKKYGLADELKERGIYDPDSIVVVPVTVPEVKDRDKFTVEDVLALNGDAERGRVTALRCVLCHEFDGVGADYGPNLKGWGAGQPSEVIARAIVKPSADISHGYEGVSVPLRAGGEVQGIWIGGDDPLRVVSTGGVSQLIPKILAEKPRKMRRSLMLSADQLGLNAQDVADVVSYLRGY